MAKPHQTNNLTVTCNNLISELISAPPGPGWTLDSLAEEVLCAIAARGAEESQEFTLDLLETSDSQSRRLLRPLLACLATKSAAETSQAPNPYKGRLQFQRPSNAGPVWILGQFENTPGKVCITLRRSSLLPPNPDPVSMSKTEGVRDLLSS